MRPSYPHTIPCSCPPIAGLQSWATKTDKWATNTETDIWNKTNGSHRQRKMYQIQISCCSYPKYSSYCQVQSQRKCRNPFTSSFHIDRETRHNEMPTRIQGPVHFLGFFTSWIRIRIYPSRFGSPFLMQIRADPDPQCWFPFLQPYSLLPFLFCMGYLSMPLPINPIGTLTNTR